MGRRSGREAQGERGLPGAAGGSASPTPDSESFFLPEGVFESELQTRWARRAEIPVPVRACSSRSAWVRRVEPARSLTRRIASRCAHGRAPDPVCTHARNLRVGMFSPCPVHLHRTGRELYLAWSPVWLP